jgi:hypothetical protein
MNNESLKIILFRNPTFSKNNNEFIDLFSKCGFYRFEYFPFERILKKDIYLNSLNKSIIFIKDYRFTKSRLMQSKKIRVGKIYL